MCKYSHAPKFHLCFQDVLSLEDSVHSCWSYAWCKFMPQVPASEGNGQKQLYTCSVFAFGATDFLAGGLQWVCTPLRPPQGTRCNLLALCLLQLYTHKASPKITFGWAEGQKYTLSVLHLFVCLLVFSKKSEKQKIQILTVQILTFPHVGYQKEKKKSM